MTPQQIIQIIQELIQIMEHKNFPEEEILQEIKKLLNKLKNQ